MQTIEGEILFTIEEIKEIENQIIRHPELANPDLIRVSEPDPLKISKVSPKHQLIFPKGNDDTGFDHIWSRHEFWSIRTDWIDSEDKNGNVKSRPQDQSKFSKESIPFYDYADIADSLYSKENIQSNDESSTFDLYCGKHENKQGVLEDYKMLLYKNSKVVHTLYPRSNKNNLKKTKKFNFTRGAVSMNQIVLMAKTEIIVPYLSEEGKTKYSIVFQELRNKRIGRTLIYVHAPNEERDVYVEVNSQQIQEAESLNNGDSMRRIHSYQFRDLRWLERLITKIDEDRNKQTTPNTL